MREADIKHFEPGFVPDNVLTTINKKADSN